MSKDLREEAFLRFKAKRMKQKNNTGKDKMTLREKYRILREKVEKIEEKVDKVYSTFN